MTTLRNTDLPKLPSEVKALIAEGVYGLYRVELEGVEYLLVTNRDKFFCLDDDGAIIPQPANVNSLGDIRIGAPVGIRAVTGSIRINMTA